MAKDDNVQFWYISISPEIQEHPKLTALRWAGKENIVLTLYDIIYYAARQIPAGIIEYEPEYPTIEDQLSIITHHQSAVIRDTLRMFEPLGWIVPVAHSETTLLKQLDVPVYPAFTYDKKGGSLRKVKKRHVAGLPTRDYIPTIEETLSGKYVPKLGTEVPNYGDIFPTYKSKSKSNNKKSSSLVSTKGTSISTTVDSTIILKINNYNKAILAENNISEADILKAALVAEKNSTDATPQNRNERVNINLTAAALQLKDGNVVRPRGLLIDAVRNNYQI